jgi:hypothetical protein
MSGDGNIKAFRPSHVAEQEEFGELGDREREAKLRQYSIRAQAGLPLFDSEMAQQANRLPAKKAAM